MTKPKRSRPRRGGDPRKLRPTTPPGYRLRTRQSQRLGGHRENPVVWFEHVDEYYDDVLVSSRCDKRAVTAIRGLLRELPQGAGRWDATFKVWHIHPGYAGPLAAALRGLGFTVTQPQIGAALSTSEGDPAAPDSYVRTS